MKNYLLSLFIISLMLLASFGDVFAQETFGTGTINVRVDAYGAVRIFTTEGVDTIQHINRCSFLVAGNPDEVLDYWNDVDVEVPTTLETTPEYGDHEISGTYNNAYSGLPPNVLVEEHVYGWDNESFCLVKMSATNQESSTIPTIIGLDIIQYVEETWENDHIYYDMTNDMMVQYENHYVAIKILSEPTTSGQIMAWYDGYEVDSSYYNWMTAGTFYADTLLTDPDGGIGIMAGESMNLDPNANRVFYYAIAVGTDETEMINNMNQAVQTYYSITAIQADNNSIPKDFILEQNYPNPFNPSTNIKFALPAGSDVKLKIYNTLGEEVADLVNEYLEAGTYTFQFDASNLTSGIYIYTLQAGGKQISNKMTLVK
jgi:hypothetical protein